MGALERTHTHTQAKEAPERECRKERREAKQVEASRRNIANWACAIQRMSARAPPKVGIAF